MNDRHPASGNHPDEDDHHGGLAADIQTVFARRTALKLLAGAGASVVALVACGDDDASTSTTPADTTAGGADTTGSTSGTSATTGTTTAATSAATTATDVSEIPEETAGPYPADGSNGPNVLTESGVVRSDITSSFGDASGTAEGIPLTVTLNLVDTANGDAALAGAAVYLWHCDREGRYSLYSEGVTDQNYLRGVQEADDSGTVTFTSIYPACYSGRWPHIHFEVYSSLDEATSGGSPAVTSQLAFPADVCDVVYATEGYEQSVQNMSQLSLESDMVFSDDGAVSQLATVTGSVDAGYTATLPVGV
jgi:protocatechuate 3,4-dioxygenase beta subunit